MINKLEKLKIKCNECKSCELHKTRNNIVFADGNPQTASIVLIGEAPGENEDLQGLPFVGRAGKLLNDYLQEAGLSREKDLYIINIVKCRPPNNRVPTKREKSTCKPFLEEQISTINPKLILLCGSTAMNEFLNEGKITEVHGKVFDIEIAPSPSFSDARASRRKTPAPLKGEGATYKAMPILHPSPLCRFPDKKNVMIQDLKVAKSLI